MPTYQYVCTECGGQIEAVQKFTDDPLTVHDACGGRLRKVFSPVGIVFKGSGFYRTDSRNGSSSGPAAANGSAKEPKEPKDSAAKDSKDSPAKSSSSEGSSSPSPGGAEKASSSSSSSSSSGSSGEKVA